MKHKAIIIAILGGLALTACTGTNHDAPNPPKDIVLKWYRVETPPSVVTEFFACFGKDGILLDQADGSASVTPNDPMCPVNGTPYYYVVRKGTDPPVQIGGMQFQPPDGA